MTNLTVYDPPMCCSTGICGTDIDQRLVDFAADLDWLKSIGVEVRRINLSQEPSEFAENDQVKDVLDKSGVEGLPVIFFNDKMLSAGKYPNRKYLAEFAGVNVGEIAGDTAGNASKSEDTGCCGGSAEDKQSTSSCC